MTFTITVSEGSQKEFDVTITDYLRNPTAGPYEYSYFAINFQTSSGYSIDSIISKEPMITVLCSGNCAECE